MECGELILTNLYRPPHNGSSTHVRLDTTMVTIYG